DYGRRPLLALPPSLPPCRHYSRLRATASPPLIISTLPEMATQRRYSATARCSLSEASSMHSVSPPRVTAQLQRRRTAPLCFRPPSCSTEGDGSARTRPAARSPLRRHQR